MVFLRFPFENGIKCLSCENDTVNINEIHSYVTSCLGISDFKLHYNGKLLEDPYPIPRDATIQVTFSLPGGKGGFGSMLRAIGAQIEKTTNREACRDLSGRRLRDINEEQRQKKWIAKESEREAEKSRRRQARIERLKSKPKHNFVDFEYEKEISQLPERVDEALNAGMEKANKRPKTIEACSVTPSKKKKLWMDEDVSSSSDSDSQDASSSGNADCHIDTTPSSGHEANESESSSDSHLLKSEASTFEKEAQIIIDSEEAAPLNTDAENQPSTSNEDKTPLNLTSTQEQIPLKSESLQEKVSFQEERLVTKEHTMSKSNEKANSSFVEIDEETETDSTEEGKSIPVDTQLSREAQIEEIDLMSFRNALELESLGLERLKVALMARGLKCGGAISDRAQRLWKIRGLEPHEYPSNLLAKNKK